MRKLFTFLGVLILVSVLAAGAVSAQSNRSENFVAPLNTAEEVPEPDNFERNPRGLAKFHLSHDGNELHYKLIVANIHNVTAAHIHIGPCGEAGPVVVWLYPPDGPPGVLIEGPFNGVLAEGVITEADIAEQEFMEIEVTDFDSLLEAMRDGDTYVNVHTEQNPLGEIRGQVTYQSQRGC
jgi:hypothetical protein